MAEIDNLAPDVLAEVQPIRDRILRITTEIAERTQRGEYFGELVRELNEISERPTGTEKTISFAGIDASELEQFQEQEPDWLVEGIASADQPWIFGAASKATKTTQLLDLTVAQATATRWLGEFSVPKRRKTLLVTGESNYRACSKRILRALGARGLKWADVTGYLRVEAIEFPTLPSLGHQLQIAADVREHGFEVVIIDPLYRGLAGLDVNRMPEVASAIVAFTKAVQPASLVISHHVTKSSARDLTGPPNLEDLSGAGLAESCGNWWLIGRNEPYKFNRIHDLIVQFGGRDEQSGLKRIVFNEANWTFEISSGDEIKEQRQREREEQRQLSKQAELSKAKESIQNCLAKENKPRPKSFIEDRSGHSQSVTRAAVAELLTQQVLKEQPYLDTRGKSQIGMIVNKSG